MTPPAGDASMRAEPKFRAKRLFTVRLPTGKNYGVDVFDDGTVYDSWGSTWLSESFARFLEAVS